MIQSSAFKREKRLNQKIFGAYSYTVKILKEKNCKKKDTKSVVSLFLFASYYGKLCFKFHSTIAKYICDKYFSLSVRLCRVKEIINAKNEEKCENVKETTSLNLRPRTQTL